jgi:signal transduction histidine kinase
MLFMKQSKLEPGILQVLKILAIFQVFGILFVRRTIGAAMGIELPQAHWLAFTLAVPLFLVVFTWIPWFHQKLRSAFVPFCLGIAGISLIASKYQTLSMFTPPAQQELELLLLVVNLWLNMLLVLVVVAWQYSAGWVIFVALAFSAADVVLSLPFMKPGTSFFPVTLVLFLARLVTVTFVGLVVQWLVHRQREQKVALADANRRLTQYAAANEQLAVSQERIRLARELHDTLSHSLSSITVQLEAAEAIWDVDLPKARTLLDGALGNTRNGMTEARRAFQALRAGALDEVGLRVGVGDLARSAAARANFALDLSLPDELPGLAPAEEQCIYRVAQEALSNVTRHARATHVRVELQHTPGQLTLTITDNGKGFDTEQVNGAHFGLKGLRERAEMVGAKLEVFSDLQRGTRLTLHALVTEMGS